MTWRVVMFDFGPKGADEDGEHAECAEMVGGQ
jgi:hypothetical protein